MKASGKPLLMTASVIYIIAGLLLLVLGIMALLVGSFVWEFLGSAGLSDVAAIIPGFLGSIFFVVFLISGAIDLIIGIIGVKQSGKPSSAMFFIVVGIIFAALTIVGSISSLGFGTILSLVLPALFIIGGFMNKKDANTSVQA